MKKFFFSLIALMVSFVSVNAQLEAGDYILQNVENGGYFGGGNDWGTHASTLGRPQFFTLEGADGVYTLDSHQYNNATAHYFAGAYCDGAATNFTFTAVGENIYVFSQDGTNFIATDGMNKAIKTVTDAALPAAQWKLISKADIVASQEAAGITTPVDVTGLIINPEFKRNANTSFYPTWTVTGADGTGTPSNLSYGSNGNNANCAESYHANNGFDLSQVVEGLKAGVYALGAKAFYRQDGTDEENLPYVYANGEKSTFPKMKGSINSMAAAYTAFLNGEYAINPIYVEVEEGGSITVGVHGDINTGLWNIWGEFSLSYYGNVSLAEVKLASYITALNEYKAEAAAITGKMDAQVAAELAAAAAATPEATAEAYEAATSALKAAISAAKNSVADYASAKAITDMTAANAAVAGIDVADVVATFNTAYENGTLDLTEGNAVIAAYNAGVQAKAASLMDMTSNIINPSFETGNIEGWTSTDGGNAATNKNFPLLTGNIFVERWTPGPATLSNGDLSQVVTLPAGNYFLTAEAQNLQQGDGTVVPGGYFIYAGEAKAEVSNTPGTFAVAFKLTEETPVTIGAKIEGCTGNWVSVDNFMLYGASLAYAENFNSLEATSEDVCGYSKDMASNNTTKYGAQPVEGWTIAEGVGVADNGTEGNGVVGDIFAYGSAQLMRGGTVGAPATNLEGEAGNAFGLLGVWGCKVQYTKDIQLEGGIYKMTIPTYCAKGASKVTNLTGVIAGGVEYFSETQSFAEGAWTTQTVEFALPQASTVTLSLGYKSLGSGSGANPHLFIDAIEIVKTADPAAALAQYKETALAEINALPVGDGLFYYTSASVDAAKAAIEAAENTDAVDAASELLVQSLPVEGQAYAVANTTASGNLSVNTEAQNVTVQADAVVYFTAVEGGYAVSNEEGSYIFKTAANNWTLSTTTNIEEAYVLNANVVEGGYTLQGAKGLLGSDNAEEGSVIYANKAVANNGIWTITAVEGSAGWDRETVTTSLGETAVTALSDLNNLVITLPAAKSIELLGEEDCAGLILQNEDGSEMYGIWHPAYGTTYSVDGENITLSGFVTAEEMTVEIPAGTTVLYIEDYGTFAVDGEEVYLPTIALNANIGAPAEPFAVAVSNNEVAGDATKAVEAAAAGVSKTFVVTAATTLVAGEAAATLSLLEGEKEFGAATVAVTETGATISFDEAGADVFTEAGTYVLSLPEGVFVDAEGTPSAAAVFQFVVIEKPEVVLADGDYLVKNVAKGTFLNGANAWGTQASVTKHGQFMTFAVLEDGKYTIDSHISNGGNNHFLNTNGYVDGAAVGYEIVEVEAGVYAIKNGETYLATNDENTIVAFDATEITEAAQWTLITKEDVLASLSEATAENPVDATALIADANFGRNNTYFDEWQGDKPGKGGDNANMCVEKWGGNSQEFNSYQTLNNLPNGTYKLSVQGFYRYNNTTDNTNDIAAAAHADGTEEINSYFYANEVEAPLSSIADEDAVATYGKMPFSQGEASAAFNLGLYTNELTVVVTDGTLTIGVKKTSHPGCDWTLWDNFELYYLGEANIEPEAIEYAVESYTGSSYEGIPVEVNVDEILAAIGAESMADVTIYSVLPNGDRVQGVRSTTDGWRDAEGNFIGWGDDAVFYLQDDADAPGALYYMGGMPGHTTEVASYTATLVYVNNATEASQEVNFTINYVEQPVLSFEVVKTIEIAHNETAGVPYSESEPAPTFNVAEVAEALGVADLSEVQTYIVNVTDGSYVVNTTDGWRDANGDAAAWSDATNGFCIKLSDPTSGIFDYTGAHDANFADGDTYVAKWAITSGDKAVILNITVTFVNATGINSIDANENVTIFNLNGIKLNKVQKGVNIINGKKIMVK